LLAKVVNDNARCLDIRGVLGFFASKLAPTGGGVVYCSVSSPGFDT